MMTVTTCQQAGAASVTDSSAFGADALVRLWPAVRSENDIKMVKNRGIEHMPTCLGGLAVVAKLAANLHNRGRVVRNVNPIAIRIFSKSQLTGTNTDRADAALIGRYFSAMHPAPS